MEFNDYVGRGFAHFQKKEYGQALENFKAAQKLKPDNPEVKELIKMTEQAVGIEGKAAQSAENEARQRAQAMGIKVEEVDQAIEDYTKALKLNPNDAWIKSSLAIAYYIRGVAFASKGEHARAIDDYSCAIKYEPNYTYAFNKRCQAYSDVGDFDKAIADCEEMRRLAPDYNISQLPSVYKDRAIAHYEKGDYARAIPDFEKVLEFDPNNNTARELLEMAKAEKAKQ
jgi:tetratricopeptide (TPR) repeat protein